MYILFLEIYFTNIYRCTSGAPLLVETLLVVKHDTLLEGVETHTDIESPDDKVHVQVQHVVHDKTCNEHHDERVDWCVAVERGGGSLWRIALVVDRPPALCRDVCLTTLELEGHDTDSGCGQERDQPLNEHEHPCQHVRPLETHNVEVAKSQCELWDVTQ